MKVRNKVFVVTGGGNGMGRELVLGLLSRGAIVAAVDINKTFLDQTFELSGENKDRLSIHVLDITDRESVEALPGHVISRHGNVDGIINNAGIIQPFVGLRDLGYDAINMAMNVNFFGTLYMVKAFLPHLIMRPEAYIIYISSMGGFLPVPGQTIYGASKAAVKLLTEGLYAELLETNVRVMAVFPGAMGSNIMENSGVGVSSKMARLQRVVKVLPPSKAAKMIINGIEQNRSRLFVGSDAASTDFLTRLNPRFASRLVFSLMKSVLLE